MQNKKIMTFVLLFPLMSSCVAGSLHKIYYRPFMQSYINKFLKPPVTLPCEPQGHKKFLGVFVFYSIGSTLDSYIEIISERAKLLAIEAKLKSGIIPPITIENIKKYPQYKDAYLAYTFAYYTHIDPLITTALFRQYPAEITRMVIKKAHKKCAIPDTFR